MSHESGERPAAPRGPVPSPVGGNAGTGGVLPTRPSRAQVVRRRVVVGPGSGLGPGITGLRPPVTRPADYAAFWGRTIAELEATHPDPVVRTVSASDGLILSGVTFRSLGGTRIHGYLLRHVDDRPRPLVVHAHGYNSTCEVRRDLAAAGCQVLGFDVRGFGRSRSAAEPSTYGWVATGLESPETALLRAAVCDYARALDVGRSLLAGHPDALARVVAHGVSFAGGLAVLAEGVRPATDLLAVGVPTFGWFEGRRRLRPGGSGAELNAFLDACAPPARRRAEEVLRYFDAVNAAETVRAPALVGIGRVDAVVPPETVYAVVNHLPTAREVWELPVSHSSRPEESLWQRFERRWVEVATAP
jgi:cephalosporin-C deacetylase